MRPSSTCFGAPPQRRVLARLAAAAGLLLCLVQWSGCAGAGEVLDRIAATGALRVCIWPDYYGITFRDARTGRRSEEHTSELQSPCNLVCRLLLEKKKNSHQRLLSIAGRSDVGDDPITLTVQIDLT